MDDTLIEWTRVPGTDGKPVQGATWNPVTGCSKVSTGCKQCYALRLWPRLAAMKGTIYSGRRFTDVACHPERLEDPLRWAKPRGIFVNSLSDLFLEDVPDSFIDQVFAVMALAPQHVFIILTKRARRMRDYMHAFSWTRVLESCTREDGSSAIPRHTLQALRHHFGMLPHHEMRSMPRRDVWPLPNVWLLVSVEDQKAADERIDYLLQTPAVVRGLSAEPLLGPIDLGRWMPAGRANWQCQVCRSFQTGYGNCHHCGSSLELLSGSHVANRFNGESWENRQPIDWVIAGGESGPRQKARPQNPLWPESLRDQCRPAGVAFFYKQHGEWAPCPPELWHGLGPVGNPAQLAIGPDGETAGGFIGKDVVSTREAQGWRPVMFVGKRAAGRWLAGELYSEFPTPALPVPSVSNVVPAAQQSAVAAVALMDDFHRAADVR